MRNKISLLFNKYIYIYIFLISFFPCYFYITHISNDYKLLNEYKYFDEITILGNKKEVENKEYIQENLIFNPNENKKFTSSDNIFFYGSNSQSFDFNNIPDSIVLTKESIKIYENILKNKKTFSFPRINYSKEHQMLYTDYFYNYNNNTVINYIYDGYKIENTFSYYPMFQADTKIKLEEKLEFIKNNIYEQNLQILDRHYFHENSFVLSPINEMELNRDKNEIFSQYGFFSISFISKIMDLYGGFSINSYEKAKKTIDLFYHLCAVTFILLFFRNNYLRFIFVMILGVALFGNSYYTFSYAPTVTNTRHILDLFIIFLLYKYTSDNYKLIYLILASILSILSIFIAKDFGQFIFLSIVAVCIIPLVKNYLDTKIINILNLLIFFLTAIIGVVFLKNYPMMENPSIKYFLDGFYSFPFSDNSIYFIILFIVFLQWFFLIIFYERLKEKYLHPYIFLIMYTQFLYTYFIWHGTTNNIVMYSYIFILPLMIIYDLFKFRFKNIILVMFIFLVIIIYLNTLIKFIIDKNNYDNVFKTHKLYKWKHPRAGGIISTYSFDNFQDSIELIKKHSFSNEIFMISKYDNILGILSQKYSAFPFFELRSTIVTADEYESIKKQILDESNLLFVDNDIERDLDEEIKELNFFQLEEYWRNENSRQRVLKLKVLKKLYQEVKNNFILVEKGILISVYRKK